MSSNEPVTGPPWTPPHLRQQQPSPQRPQQQGPSRQEISDAALSHFLGVLSILGPILMYALKGNTSRWVKANAAEALNFHLSMLIYSIGWMVLSFVAAFVLALATHGIGIFLVFPLLLVPMAMQITFSIIGGVKANKGEFYHYPITIRMVKG